jgi:hypothetical protein
VTALRLEDEPLDRQRVIFQVDTERRAEEPADTVEVISGGVPEEVRRHELVSTS